MSIKLDAVSYMKTEPGRYAVNAPQSEFFKIFFDKNERDEILEKLQEKYGNKNSFTADEITDEGELKSLKELVITSISVNENEVKLKENTNQISHTSTFSQNNQVKTINDVWFKQEAYNSTCFYKKN